MRLAYILIISDPDQTTSNGLAFSRTHDFSKILNKLMVSLGYSEYVTQGGDLGHYVRR